jgi:ribosomal protein L16/L10AE
MEEVPIVALHDAKDGFYFVSKGRGEPQTEVMKIEKGNVIMFGGNTQSFDAFKQMHPAAVLAEMKLPKLHH